MIRAPQIPRRIVTKDNDAGTSVTIADGPAPDVMFDPARPGFISARIWVTDATPVQINQAHDALALPHGIAPPPRGSVCRIVTFPPDDTFRGSIGAAEVAALFHAMGAPRSSTQSP